MRPYHRKNGISADAWTHNDAWGPNIFLFSLSCMTTPLAFSFVSYHYHNFSCNYKVVYHVKTSYCMSFISYILPCHVYHIVNISCLSTYHVIPYTYHISNILSNASHHNINHKHFTLIKHFTHIKHITNGIRVRHQVIWQRGGWAPNEGRHKVVCQ